MLVLCEFVTSNLIVRDDILTLTQPLSSGKIEGVLKRPL